jgi:hypothetical protein
MMACKKSKLVAYMTSAWYCIRLHTGKYMHFFTNIVTYIINNMNMTLNLSSCISTHEKFEVILCGSNFILIQCVLLTGSPTVGIYKQAYTRPIFRLLQHHIIGRKWDTFSFLMCLMQGSSTRGWKWLYKKRVFILNNHVSKCHGKLSANV